VWRHQTPTWLIDNLFKKMKMHNKKTTYYKSRLAVELKWGPRRMGSPMAAAAVIELENKINVNNINYNLHDDKIGGVDGTL
jgi:hypothetical protein